MKRRLLSAFLAVMMVLTMAPVAFAADGDAGSSTAVAKIGDATYATLADAVVNAKTGDTIVMTAATDISKTGLSIASDKGITLDLNGYEVKAANTGAGNIKVYGKLTLKDSTDTSANGEGQGKITTVTKTYIRNQADQPIIYAVNGDFVMQSGLIDTATGITNNSTDGQFGVGVQNETANASVTIEGGKIKAGWYAVSGNGQMINHDGNITVNGGILESTADYAIYHPQAGTTTINGGVIYGHAGGIQINRGTLVVNNGTVTSKGIGSTGSWGDGTGGTNNAAIHANAKYGDVSVSIKDGKVTAEGNAVTIEQGTAHTATIAISGGTFSSDVSTYCEKNYYTEQNTDNTYTVKSMKDVAVAKIDDTYYKTLADAVAAAKADEATTITLLKDVELPSYIYIKDKKNITLDLNGKNITRTGNGVFYVGNAKLRVTGTGTIFENQRDGFAPIIAKGSPDDVADYTTITIDENVTLKGDYAGIFVDTDTAGKNSYHNYGLVINMKGSIDLTAIDGGVSAYGVYVQGLNKITSGNVMQINLDGVTINTGDEAIYAAGYAKWNVKNCTFNAENAAIEVRAGDMTIDGGVYTAMASEFKCEANGNGSTTQGAALAIMQHTTKLPISVYVKNGVFHSAAAVAEKNIQKNDPKPNVDLQIADGQFNGVVVADDVLNFISGGDFSTDPSGYLAVSAETGKKYVAGAINESPYFFRVALVEDNQIPVVPAVGETAAPSAKELENTGMTKEAAEAVAAAAKKVAAGDTEIKEAVAPIATGITDEKAAKYQQAAANDVDDVEKIEVRAYLEVKPTAYNGSAYTLDITPKYDVVVVGTKNGATAKKVVETNTLNVTKATEVSVQLPEGFVTNTDNLYVQHKGHEYDAAVTANNGVYTANFTNPHGFSPFTISKTSQTVATIGTDKYTSFADAVSAVPANGTIEITGGTSPYTGTANKTFTVKNSTSADITVNGQTIKPTKSYTFKYTHSSGSSSGGSSSGKTTYKVTTSAVNNGGVNASPSNAEKGATITITLSPDKGYKLDKLTVTDGSGKTVSTVKKSDTVYTFTMPASAVKVGVSYVKATETPSETKFNDVSANDWFASAVDYVTGKGMMNGTADNTFSPKANTTRGMVVTVLYRLENQPSTSAASFTDVASGAYYANAVAWANANGIVSGYGSGKFGPNDKVTREQLAAILYRYAQYKKYDVSVGEDTNILSYDDAQSISSYAIPAIQWACGAGVVTGKSGSKLDPKGNATRAEVAAMLMRFCENVK
mgnify:CR=1 FL=1